MTKVARIDAIVLWILLSLSIPSYGDIQDYCAAPPFISQVVPPNILIVIDVSGSMQFPAHGPCEWKGYNNKKVAQCGESSVSYDPLREYYGYFKTDKYYKYESNKFVENENCDDMGEDCIPGNLLNWATMSRIDVLRKVLIGGKSLSQQQNTHTLRGEGGNWIFTDENLHCKFSVTGGSYPELDHKLSIENYNGTCVLGTLTKANIKVDVPELERRGVVQNLADKDYDGQWDPDAPRFGLMVYASDNRYGCMRTGIGTSDMSSFLNALQNEAPYWGTPTGEALENALDYFEQDNFTHYCPGNGAYIGGPGSSKDPWQYWCQKSFVLLISDGEWNGDVDPVRPAREGKLGIHGGRNYDLRDDLDNAQVVTTYTVYAFSDSEEGRNSLQQTAIFGSFNDLCPSDSGNDWPYPYTDYPDWDRRDNDPYGSRDVSLPNPQCDPNGRYDSCCREWDGDGDGYPDNYYEAKEGKELENKITEAIYDILKKVSSGTAVSVLSQEAESGANLIQAVFYPQRTFMWETDVYTLNWIGQLYNWWIYRGLEVEKMNVREDTVEDKTLKLDEDYIIHFVFEDNQLKVKAYKDANGDGVADSSDPTVTYVSLDQAHDVWEAGEKLKNTEASLRTLYTNISGNLTDFTEENWSLIDDYLGSEYSGNETAARNLISYIRGEDISGFRSRSIGSSVWKLADIIYSTPRIVTYDDYSVVYVGANDGMLHAFRLGYLDTTVTDAVARIQNSKDDTGYDKLGEELWAFIPQNALPYLKYYADSDYCHLYYVDLTPFVFEADYDTDGTIEKVLIGGMRLGGAVGCNDTSCVTPPSDTCPDTNSTSCVGLSSYFALDITDPEDPQLLWEFSHPDLGFSYSGPAVVRKGDDYYVVFLSGPTNYSGESAQNLKIFVVKLDDASVTTIDTGITNAFGGRLFIYVENDPIYFGYTQQGSWRGGVLKLDTSGSDPADWEVVPVLVGTEDEPVGPVTVSVKTEVFGGETWLFFGEGRYFTKDDDASAQRYIYGVKASCADPSKGGCSRSDLMDKTTDNSTTFGSEYYGWYIELDPPTGDFGSERLISDPTVYKSNETSGEVYFVTMQPNTHPCEFGGRSYVWRMSATSGGAVEEEMPGVLLVQLSTGQVLEVSQKGFFTHAGGRKAGPFRGVPGEQASKIITPMGVGWIGEILQWIER